MIYTDVQILYAMQSISGAFEHSVLRMQEIYGLYAL